MHLVTVIYAAYGSISLFLYLVVFIIIYRLGTKHLNTAFSKLIILYSIVNMISYLNSWFSHRLRIEPIAWPVYESLNSFDGLRNFLTFIMPLTNYNQSVCNLMLTFNRFTAISFPFRSQSVILSSVIFASASACSRLPMFTVWKFKNNTYLIEHTINLNAFWYQIGFCATMLSIGSVFNVISVLKLR
ncbi:hypothetical protein PMAYCL1PPCAC_12880, partial [Pristionchus mayeri]